MVSEVFLRRMEEILEINANTLKENDKLSDLTEWDSMAVLGFIAMANNEWGVKIEVDDIGTCKSFSDLYNLLER